jgi:cytochrome c553
MLALATQLARARRFSLHRHRENRTTVRSRTWVIVAFSVAIPVAALAAEGKPDVGKARAEGAGCFACHGVDGVATADGLATDKNVPNLAAQPDLYLQFQLVFFRKGVRKNEVMNAMAEQLSDDDLRNVSAYFASLPAPNTTAAPDTAPEDTELGGKVASAIHCTNCHGDHLEGVDNIPRLSGQREDYLYKALRDFKSGARTSTGAAGMAEVVYPLGDLEMKALAHYLSRLH